MYFNNKWPCFELFHGVNFEIYNYIWQLDQMIAVILRSTGLGYHPHTTKLVLSTFSCVNYTHSVHTYLVVGALATSVVYKWLFV